MHYKITKIVRTERMIAMMTSKRILYSFFEKFLNVFSSSKQNTGENILQNGESLIAMKHDGSCCEDFL